MATNDREKVINKFIVRIFKMKQRGMSRLAALVKSKKWIHDQQRKWTSQLELLFESTWRKEIPADISKELKREDVEEKRKAPRIKPNKKAEKPAEEEPKPKAKRAYVKDTSRFDEPEDLDDPKYDVPEFQVKTKQRKCVNCGGSFTQSNDYPNRLLCPTCNAKVDKMSDVTDDDSIYASNNIYISEETASERRDRILNIK